jgi:hypothetical protein
LFTALNDLVKDHCTKQNSKACQNTLTNIGILKRFKDIFTKPLRPNQQCRNNHGKGLT